MTRIHNLFFYFPFFRFFLLFKTSKTPVSASLKPSASFLFHYDHVRGDYSKGARISVNALTILPIILCSISDCNAVIRISETVFKVVNEEHDKLEAKKKAKHQTSITG